MKQRGFTFVELMVAIGVMLVVMAAATSLYRQSVQVSNTVTQQADMQSELRAASNQLARDLNQAGTGIPLGGIPIPSLASGGTNPRFACDSSLCYITVNNTFTQGVLYKVTPANGIGPNVVQASDAIVITYLDPNLNWTAYPTQTAASNGTTITMPAGTTPALNAADVGLTVGDVLLLQNSNGAAAGVVTNFDAATRVISFANLDPLNINQSGATTGNISSLRFNPVPGVAPFYPPITVSRIMMVTYFIQTINTPTGTDTQLMRQIGARTPTPVADHIDDLQFTYDVFDTNTSTLTTALPDAATGTPAVPVPNQIRKVNVTMSVRSPRPNAQGVYDHYSLTTSIGPRNLSFHDRYN
jgi:prepilin-type N-terminal cleavage/methylation domain-containing protein